jgi:hypothetical protein
VFPLLVSNGVLGSEVWFEEWVAFGFFDQWMVWQTGRQT